MITKENIEAYLLDFIEGNLNANELLELETFLSENPTYNVHFELLHLEQDEQLDFNKSSLKKNPIFEPNAFHGIHEGTIEEKMLVAATENVLSETEMVHFKNHLINNLTAQKEFSIYKKTRLTVDNAIVFPNVSRLKRNEGKVFVFNFIAKCSVAASVFGIALWLFFGSNSQQGNGVAQIVPNIRKETRNPQVLKTNQPTIENVASLHVHKEKQKQLPIIPLFQPKVASTAPQEILHDSFEITNVNIIFDTVHPVNNSTKNDVLPSVELAKISMVNDKSLTPFEFVYAKVKKRFFGKENPSQEELYASISNKISYASGISFSFFRKYEKGHRSLHLRIGKFSIEKN